jgi:hypothetical protein
VCCAKNNCLRNKSYANKKSPFIESCANKGGMKEVLHETNILLQNLLAKRLPMVKTTENMKQEY